MATMYVSGIEMRKILALVNHLFKVKEELDYFDPEPRKETHLPIPVVNVIKIHEGIDDAVVSEKRQIFEPIKASFFGFDLKLWVEKK